MSLSSWLDKYDGNVLGVVLGWVGAVVIATGFYFTRQGRKMRELDRRVAYIEEHHITHTELETLAQRMEAKISELRLTRQADIDTIRLELEHSRKDICRVNEGLRGSIDELQNQLRIYLESALRNGNGNG